jgi:hypothetical protein
MSASQSAKDLGAKSLKGIAAYYNKDPATIQNWHRDNRRLFNAAVTYYIKYGEDL